VALQSDLVYGPAMDYKETYSRNRVSWLYAIARSEISPSAVKLGLLFATFVLPEEREEVSPSYDWIVEKSHLSRATVARCLVELEKGGYLGRVIYPGHRVSYHLPFTGDAVWEPPNPSSLKIELPS
jgi:hypothetical protein